MDLSGYYTNLDCLSLEKCQAILEIGNLTEQEKSEIENRISILEDEKNRKIEFEKCFHLKHFQAYIEKNKSDDSNPYIKEAFTKLHRIKQIYAQCFIIASLIGGGILWPLFFYYLKHEGRQTHSLVCVFCLGIGIVGTITGLFLHKKLGFKKYSIGYLICLFLFLCIALTTCTFAGFLESM